VGTDFSVISQNSTVRAIVQGGLLERAFHNGLFPRLMFRGEAVPQEWTHNVGDSMTFTGEGLLTPDASPLVPGQDPDVASATFEQWTAQVQQYGKPAIDTAMPNTMVAIAELFMSNARRLGLVAGQAINRLVRDKMYNAAESGTTNVDGAFTSVSTIRVKRLNGLTRARNPTSTAAGASTVSFSPVSSGNPLAVTIFDNGAPANFNIIAFLADNPGDELGPGTITLATSVTNVATGAWVHTIDRSDITFVGGGNSVRDITATNIPSFTDVRSALTNLQNNNVPVHPDGRYHAHMSPTSQARLYDTPEWQRLNTALPDFYYYRQYTLGEFLGVMFYNDTECPQTTTVVGGSTATFDLRDPFAPELWNTGATTGIPLQRIIITGQGGIMEYHMDQSALITEAGLNGKTGAFSITNNGIEVLTERISLIIRAPIDRLQQIVSMAWSLFADWVVRTDAATGDAARYKRFATICHA
jgi:hypothetical protein